MLEVRPGTQADLAWLLPAAARSALEQTVPRERLATWAETLAPRVEGLLRAALVQPGALLLVAAAAGVPVGYALACLQPNPLTGQAEGILVDLFVEPPWRRRGVARQLLAALEAGTRVRGARALALPASLYAGPALRLATGLGYWPERVLLVKALD